jgi:hypothetical protein
MCEDYQAGDSREEPGMRYHLYINRGHTRNSNSTWEEVALVKAIARSDAIMMLGDYVTLNRIYKSGYWMLKSDRQLQPDNAVRREEVVC